MGFTESIFQKISLVVFPVACLFHIIGLASPYWISISETFKGNLVEVNSGIWKYCVSAQCIEFPSGVPDWLKGVRALEILGLLVLIAAVAATVLSVFMSSESTRRLGKLIAIATAFVAVVLIIVGIIIFATKLEEIAPLPDMAKYLSWAFALCIVAAILSAIGGSLMSIATFKQ